MQSRMKMTSRPIRLCVVSITRFRSLLYLVPGEKFELDDCEGEHDHKEDYGQRRSVPEVPVFERGGVRVVVDSRSAESGPTGGYDVHEAEQRSEGVHNVDDAQKLELLGDHRDGHTPQPPEPSCSVDQRGVVEGVIDCCHG